MRNDGFTQALEGRKMDDNNKLMIKDLLDMLNLFTLILLLLSKKDGSSSPRSTQNIFLWGMTSEILSP